ncbi:hypothetical protein PMAYCL1PPCAC_00009 [Pristionchus mayeri]|uniref:TIL domain-containing protein n=1 Tax=Pristionchus mayeri TaxID=1317129 RepID=A0AAN4YY15_9BILA|nr:hypothetical protein PMAYCL1PPCAC_00009 [Pristionchus mayeri]
MSYIVLFAIALVSCVSAQQWSEWKPVNGPCTEPCGMCGTKVVAERTCQSGTCPGDSQKTEVCEKKVCLFPKKTCCVGYKMGLANNHLVCVPK